MYETCKNAQIELQHFCSPKKVVPTVFARYSREQLRKYTGKLVVTTDPGIRVWYGMVWWVYQKDGKTCEGSPLSALQAYNQIISPWFSYYFPSRSLLFSYFSPIVPYCFYYLPIISLLVPYFCPIISPIYKFLILPYYCPICLPGFQNDKLRHLEWLCFDCHTKCLKPAKIHIIWFPTKILDFTVFWWHFPKNDYRNQKWWPFQIILTFLFITCYPFDGSCYMYETCKNAQIELQHFCSPKKVVPTAFARYNREQLGKYTGKLVVTTDPGIRVWYGMVVYQKDDKTCEGSPLFSITSI